MAGRAEKLNDYEGFLEKFKPKLTTDDCYTPEPVYQAVKYWACDELGIDPDTVVRPFWPGEDYKAFEYPEGCTVIDNPPFSILAQIKRWYIEHGIRFFLFAPSLTLMGSDTACKITHIAADANITYENGAVVRTGFVTNLCGDIVLMSSPSLYRVVKQADEEVRRGKKKKLPKYVYPMEVCTSAIVQRYSRYGVEFAVRRGDCLSIRALDSMVEHGKAIFGGGLLLSERAAAERAAAERAAAERAAATEWKLSDREMDLVRGMGRR